MAVTLTASLVWASTPAPVQIVLNGVPSGAEYLVQGTTGDGSVWSVPGGEGVSAGAQVVLTDNRSALNTPVTYRATVEGVVYSTAPVTVTGPRYLIQSLDGQTTVEFVWQDDGNPRELEPRAQFYSVPGRTRPPVRYATGGDGSGGMRIRTSPAATLAMVDLLRAGRPVVIRTDGTVRDLPAVEIVLIARAQNELWPAVVNGQPSRDRVWSLDYMLVDDPEPGTALSVFTWDDFDAAMAGRTWSAPVTNQIANALFETDTSGWVAGGSGAVLSRPLTGGHVGPAHARVTAGTSTAFALNGTVTFPVVAGESFAASARVRGTVGRSVNLRVTWTGAPATSAPVSTIASTSAWQQITYVGTVPTGATAGRLDVLVPTGASSGNVLDVDTVSYLRGTTTPQEWTSGSSTVDPAELSFDELFAASTWDLFDTYDWSQL